MEVAAAAAKDVVGYKKKKINFSFDSIFIISISSKENILLKISKAENGNWNCWNFISHGYLQYQRLLAG